MNRNQSDYAGIVRQLPYPTWAQTERFARYVASAHSWYKHLPIEPKVPFVFYLDPGAGMSLVHTQTGETALVEIADERFRFHYTWQKTADYRRRFGFWNYLAPSGSSFLFAGEGGVVSTKGTGLAILDDSGDWVRVPSKLVRQGTALVSAFLHPWPNFHIWANSPERFGLSNTAHPNGSTLPPEAHPILSSVWNALERQRAEIVSARELAGAIPPHLLELIQKVAVEKRAEIVLNPGEACWDWPAESWLEELLSHGVEERLVPSVIRYVELEVMQSFRAPTELPPNLESVLWPQATLRTLKAAINEERAGQLLAITQAMRDFVEAVYQ